MIAKTLYGLEDVLADELRALGAKNIEIGRRMVSFEGDRELLYRANIHLRTALRILVPIATFEASNADEVYQYLYDHVDWFEYLTSRTTFAFDTVVYSEKFTHSKFLAYRGKDAISDYFTDNKQRRPNVSVVDPDIHFHIHVSHTTVTLALDSSGESLHKRGYRVGQNDAPVSEVLAAGILMRTGWKGETDLIDPMCGSGTFLIEAALIALNIPPGIFREKYAFEKWKDFDPELLSHVLDDWEEKKFEHQIYGSDISAKAIAISRGNITKAGVQKYIRLSVCPIEELHRSQEMTEKCLIVTNPPYGERMRNFELEKVYGALGTTLKHEFCSGSAWVLTSSIEGFHAIGLKHFHREKLFNGSIECELRGYELFDGKRKEFVRDKVARSGLDPDAYKERQSTRRHPERDKGGYHGKARGSKSYREHPSYREKKAFVPRTKRERLPDPTE